MVVGLSVQIATSLSDPTALAHCFIWPAGFLMTQEEGKQGGGGHQNLPCITS